MNTPSKLAGFAAGLLAIFGVAAGLGAAAGPMDATATDNTESHTSTDGGGHGSTTNHTAPPADTADLPGGLMISQNGYTLDLVQTRLRADERAPLRFRILGPDASPVTDYTKSHGKDLHLIAVRRDMSGYQHVHPRLGPDGTWSVPLNLSDAGEYRVFADFTPATDDQKLTLGADLSVPGDYEPQPLPKASTTAQVDGYTVTLNGTLSPDKQTQLTLSVSKDGRPVTDLQPYLEAYGHLVALRDGDLAYLHVHPAGGPGDNKTPPGPDITFFATAPSAGSYRLFLDFRHDGKVRTAEFTVTTNGVASSPPKTATHNEGHSGESAHDH